MQILDLEYEYHKCFFSFFKIPFIFVHHLKNSISLHNLYGGKWTFIKICRKTSCTSSQTYTFDVRELPGTCDQ